jgi:hypothetical protein
MINLTIQKPGLTVVQFFVIFLIKNLSILSSSSFNSFCVEFNYTLYSFRMWSSQILQRVKQTAWSYHFITKLLFRANQVFTRIYLMIDCNPYKLKYYLDCVPVVLYP